MDQASDALGAKSQLGMHLKIVGKLAKDGKGRARPRIRLQGSDLDVDGKLGDWPTLSHTHTHLRSCGEARRRFLVGGRDHLSSVLKEDQETRPMTLLDGC